MINVLTDTISVGIMQPYFFPYLGYYSLIKHTDDWIINDEVQMIHKGWIARNRILKQQGGWHYIHVPLVKFPHTRKIKFIRIKNNNHWKEKILAQLKQYKNKAPYYHQVFNLLKFAFEREFKTITAQNAYLLGLTCEYMGIDFKYDLLSRLNLDLSEIYEPDDWSLIICKQLGYTDYINPILGKQFYNRHKYEDNDVNLQFLEFGFPQYDQKNKEFIPGLSVIDAMMFNSPEEINQMLDQYQLVK